MDLLSRKRVTAEYTKVGQKLCKLRLDELPQLFNILTGDMTFVGTRPGSEKICRLLYG